MLENNRVRVNISTRWMSESSRHLLICVHCCTQDRRIVRACWMCLQQSTHWYMTLLIVEPFYGGSHKHLVDVLCRHYTGTCSSRGLKHALFTLPAKKWHWRARTSALTFAQTIPHDVSYKCVICLYYLHYYHYWMTNVCFWLRQLCWVQSIIKCYCHWFLSFFQHLISEVARSIVTRFCRMFNGDPALIIWVKNYGTSLKRFGDPNTSTFQADLDNFATWLQISPERNKI